MKKLTRNPLFLAAIIAVVFVFDSCFHGSGSDLSETTASSTPFNYNYLIIQFPATKGKTLKISPKSAGMYLGAGLKASCSISKSNASFGLGLAVWLDLDITINSLNAILDQLVKGGVKEANESNNLKLAELLMELFGNKVKKLEVKVADVNINV